jgi:hypothetical protein
MNVNSRGHNLDTRFKQLFLKIKHPPGLKNPVGVRLLHHQPEAAFNSHELTALRCESSFVYVQIGYTAGEELRGGTISAFNRSMPERGRLTI